MALALKIPECGPYGEEVRAEFRAPSERLRDLSRLLGNALIEFEMRTALDLPLDRLLQFPTSAASSAVPFSAMMDAAQVIAPTRTA